MMIHLIQPRELYGPPERQAELQQAWDRNAGMFNYTTVPEGRPTFSYLFALCMPEAINVIANSDIYFDHTLLDNAHRLGIGDVWALSRWDDTAAGLKPYHKADSQDVWIVRGGPYKVDAPFPMGIPGCDNALAHIMHTHGWRVTNPCQTVRAIHLHRTGYRTYGDGPGKPKTYAIQPPYLKVPPCTL